MPDGKPFPMVIEPCLKFTHCAIGQIPDDVLENIGGRWDYIVNRIRENALRKHADRSR